jgi:hypothetical protein
MIFPRMLFIVFLFSLYSCSKIQLEQGTARSPAGSNLLLPESLSEMDKVKILLAINKEIPELFANASRFDIDILKILEDQTQLQQLLLQDPRFLERWNQKQLMSIEIIINDPSEKTIQTKQLKRESVKEWKVKLLKKCKEILQSNQNLQQLTIDKITSLNKFTSAGFLNGLILNLPPSSQVAIREIQKKSDIIQIESYLENHLPVTLKNFKSNPPEINFSRKYLIERWKTLIAIEKDAQTFLDLLLFTENRNVPLSTFANQIEQLSDADFVTLADPDYQKNALRKLFNHEKLKIINFYKNYLRIQLNQTEIITSTLVEGYKITLKEQNPNLAIFRGCTGGDCSSQNSFPFPNDPNERVFYIYDKENRLKGYLSGTMLTDPQGETNLYINTIAGNRVNAIDTEMIFQAIFQERLSLGVASIILPNSKNLPSLINFPLIRSVYNDAISNRPETQIYYRDQDLRKIIEKFKSIHNVGDYDHMDQNLSGVTYSPLEKSRLSLKTTVTNIDNVFNVSLAAEKIDASAFLELRLNLLNSGNIELSDKITSATFTGHDQALLNEVIEIIQGKIILTTAEIENKMDSLSKHFNISPLQLKMIQEKYLLNAYLLAKDAKDSRYFSINLNKLLKDFKMTNSRPLVPRSKLAYQRWQEELLNASEYETIRRTYLLMLQHKIPIQIEIKDDLLRFSYALLKEPEGEYIFSNKQIHRTQKAVPELKYFSSKVLKEAIASRDINTLLDFSRKIFSSPYAADWEDLAIETLDAAIRFHDDQTISNLIQYSLSQLHAEAWKDLASKVLTQAINFRNPTLLRSFPAYVFSTPHASEWGDLLDQTIDVAIERKDTRLMSLIAEHAFLYPNSIKNKKLITKLVSVSIQNKYIDVIASLAKGVFSQDYSIEWKELFHKLIVEAIRLENDEAIFNILLGQLSTKNNPDLSVNAEIKNFFYKTLFELIASKERVSLRYISRIVISGVTQKEYNQLIFAIFPMAIELNDHRTLENIKKALVKNCPPELQTLFGIISRYRNEEDFEQLKNDYYGSMKRSGLQPPLSCNETIKSFF